MLFCVFVWDCFFGRGLKLKSAEVAVANSWSLCTRAGGRRRSSARGWPEVSVQGCGAADARSGFTLTLAMWVSGTSRLSGGYGSHPMELANRSSLQAKLSLHFLSEASGFSLWGRQRKMSEFKNDTRSFSRTSFTCLSVCSRLIQSVCCVRSFSRAGLSSFILVFQSCAFSCPGPGFGSHGCKGELVVWPGDQYSICILWSQ